MLLGYLHAYGFVNLLAGSSDTPFRRVIMNRQTGWLLLGNAALTAAVMVIAGALFPAGLFFQVWVGAILTFLAIPYTLFVTIFLAIRRSRAKKTLLTLPEEEVQELQASGGGAFETFSQRQTFTVNVGLIVLGLLMLLVTVTGMTDDFVSLIFFGGLSSLAITGIWTICVNAPYIYSRKIVLQEEAELQRKGKRATLIRGNRILSYIVWWGYSAATVYITGQFSDMLATMNSSY